MASSILHSRTGAETEVGVLPIDAIYEILILLPAEELCRLRVVCRPWESLLSDPMFIAAHAARHRRQLIVVGHGESYPDDDGILCRIIDLSGRIIKQIRSKKDEWVISTQCNLACVARGSTKRCRLVNLVTGERFALPEGLSPEHTPRKLDFLKYKVAVAFGHVASTEEFKLLRVIGSAYEKAPFDQVCEVFTHGGSRGARWRAKKTAEGRVQMSPLSRVVIHGVVYFLLDEYAVSKQDVRPKGIASFDLLTEEWRAILRGPASFLAKNKYRNLSLAALNGSLVLVHCTRFLMDLWFLKDIEKGLWVKQHTVQINVSVHGEFLAHPLAILKNGRIVMHICTGSRGLLRIYNPWTSTYTDVAKMVSSVGIGLYAGNLLSLANDAT